MTYFRAAFQLTKMKMMEVDFYYLGDNEYPYFATSAEEWIKSKRDFREVGQCQDHVLTGYARRFWKKWDRFHLRNMTEEKNAEMMEDLKVLMQHYNYIYKEYQEGETMYSIPFRELQELSKMNVKKFSEVA